MGVEPVLTGTRLGGQDWTTPGYTGSIRETDQGRGTGKEAAAPRKLYRRRHPGLPACQSPIRPHCTFSAHLCNPVEAPPNDRDRSFDVGTDYLEMIVSLGSRMDYSRLVAWLPTKDLIP